MEVKLTNLQDFQLPHIFECGQCFRWNKEQDNSYTGVIKEGIIRISMEGSNAKICTTIEKDTQKIINDYFDLDTDYKKIKDIISQNDQIMQEAIQFGNGIRILRQDPWEMLISFIISAANNIPRIMKTVENLSRAYGKKVFFMGKEYYLFPTPEELSKASIKELRMLNLGFRDKYVYGATQKVLNGEINLDKIKKMSYEDAKKELLKIEGVGEKVADCILLFSMEKREAFPIDTWIKKVMTSLYQTPSTKNGIKKCAQTKFGAYAGIAQQYLFYYMRTNEKQLSLLESAG